MTTRSKQANIAQLLQRYFSIKKELLQYCGRLIVLYVSYMNLRTIEYLISP